MLKPADFTTTLGGQRWHVKFVRRRHPKVGKDWGACYWDQREIYVRYDLSEKHFVDTLIHECIHALSGLHYCAEDWVNETATEIAGAVLAAGIGKK